MKDYIRTLLAAHKRRIIPREDLRESAVLLPLCWRDGDPQVIVTMRSMDVEHHKGEICFPGGRAESTDKGLVETALREAYEEIGLCRDDVDVLGLLDDHISIVGYHITPVVGAIPYPYDFKINSESEVLLLVPLRKALSDSAWMAERTHFRGRGDQHLLPRDRGGRSLGCHGTHAEASCGSDRRVSDIFRCGIRLRPELGEQSLVCTGGP